MVKGICEIRVQVLRGAAYRVGPLALRLREGPLFSVGGPLKTGGLVNDTTLVQPLAVTLEVFLVQLN